MITYANVVDEMLLRLPDVREADSYSYIGEEGNYIVFEDFLVPWLQDALIAGDLARIVRIAGFIEEVSEAASEDRNLRDLIAIAVGEWLPTTLHKERLAPWLGEETKRITGYVPGLATQRTANAENRLSNKLKQIASRILHRYE